MLVHLNGSIIPSGRARVSAFDRGFIFGDSLYEGLRSVPRTDGARVIGMKRHQMRLGNGLARMSLDWDVGQLPVLCDELLRANGVQEAFIYVQVTRGTPPPGAPLRSRAPGCELSPTVFAYCLEVPPLEGHTEPKTLTVMTHEDPRWMLGLLKSTSLAGNVVVSLDADRDGAHDALMVRDGLVTEATASNAIIALKSGEIVTPSLDSAPILAGVTREILVDQAPEIVERAVRAEELEDASEIMLVGTTTLVSSVVSLDGRVIGDGTAGPVSRRLLGVLIGAVLEGRDDP